MIQPCAKPSASSGAMLKMFAAMSLASESDQNPETCQWEMNRRLQVVRLSMSYVDDPGLVLQMNITPGLPETRPVGGHFGRESNNSLDTAKSRSKDPTFNAYEWGVCHARYAHPVYSFSSLSRKSEGGCDSTRGLKILPCFQNTFGCRQSKISATSVRS